MQAVVKKTGVDTNKIGDVIAGCVTQAGEQGVNIARRTALLAGFPISVPGVALNRFCSSGQQAIHFAAQADCAAGDHDYVLASGVESMTRVPMGADSGDTWKAIYLSMREQHDLIHQGESAERIAEKWGITRRDVDEFAAESHRRAAAAAHAGIGAGKHTEIVAYARTRCRRPRTFRSPATKAFAKPSTWKKWRSFRTVFRPNGNGVVTAANSSQISDGAARGAGGEQRRGRKPTASNRAHAFRARVVIGSDPTMQLDGVIPATRLALEKAWFEHSTIWTGSKSTKLSPPSFCRGRANSNQTWRRSIPWGGACAHGHPIGGTGSILMAKTAGRT